MRQKSLPLVVKGLGKYMFRTFNLISLNPKMNKNVSRINSCIFDFMKWKKSYQDHYYCIIVIIIKNDIKNVDEKY